MANVIGYHFRHTTDINKCWKRKFLDWVIRLYEIITEGKSKLSRSISNLASKNWLGLQILESEITWHLRSTSSSTISSTATFVPLRSTEMVLLFWPFSLEVKSSRICSRKVANLKFSETDKDNFNYKALIDNVKKALQTGKPVNLPKDFHIERLFPSPGRKNDRRQKF